MVSGCASSLNGKRCWKWDLTTNWVESTSLQLDATLKENIPYAGCAALAREQKHHWLLSICCFNSKQCQQYGVPAYCCIQGPDWTGWDCGTEWRLTLGPIKRILGINVFELYTAAINVTFMTLQDCCRWYFHVDASATNPSCSVQFIAGNLLNPFIPKQPAKYS